MVERTSARADQRLARRGGALEALWPLAAGFGAAARLRGALYDRRWLPIEHVEAPVVSVGNLSVGGTGKTPAVAWLVRLLDELGRRPGVASRGYKRAAGAVSDEGRMLDEALPGLLREEDPDRVAAARRLVAKGCDVVVLDDGFQHRRLAREVDLVLVDALRPWGLPSLDGRPAVRACLPRGLLREPPAALARADALLVTRCDQASPVSLEALYAELERLAPGRPLAFCEHQPTALVDPDGARLAPESLGGREWTLVSGIGNPQAFALAAQGLGARVREQRVFADHHEYTAEECADIRALGADVLCTAKDAVKLRALGLDCWVLLVELRVVSGEPVLRALLERLPPARAQRERENLHEGLHG